MHARARPHARFPSARLATTLLVATLALMIAGCERSLIYYPSKASEEQLAEIARAKGLVPWTNHEGSRIGWTNRPDASPASPTAVVVFHGNAGYAAHRNYFVEGFFAATRPTPWDVYLFEYPGYGSRPGKPSESANKAAARAAVESLLGADYTSLYLVGESLGGGIACHLAATWPEQIDGLLLVTPFTSLLDVARHHYPGFLVSMLLSERYDNVEALNRYQGPIAILLAERDEVVPAKFARALYDSYDGPKRLWEQTGRSHNTLDYDSQSPWWQEVTDFLQNE